MKNKLLLPVFGLTAVSLCAGSLFLAQGSNAIQAKADGVASAQPGDAPIGEETDWAPVTNLADINTSDFYMLRVTCNENYQYSTGELDFVNGVALYTDAFANARMFQFVQGTYGFKVKGLFDLAPAELENCHYLQINHADDAWDLWVTDNEDEATDFVGSIDGDGMFMVQEYGRTEKFGALSIKYGDHAGQAMILNLDGEFYQSFYEQGSLLPMELVSIPAPADPEADALAFATAFTDDLADVCADQNADNSAGVSAKWATHKAAFEALSPEAKTAFAESNDATINQARQLYEHCVARYGLAEWEDAPEIQAAKFFARGDAAINGANVAIISGVIASSSLLTALLLIARKRKQN